MLDGIEANEEVIYKSNEMRFADLLLCDVCKAKCRSVCLSHTALLALIE